MKKLKTVLSIAKEILESYPQTRNCDGLLYLKVLEHYSNEKGIDLRLLSVPVFLKQMNTMGFPGPETVRRTRQKLQAEYPHLAACEAVEAYRTENERAYREFARSEV